MPGWPTLDASAGHRARRWDAVVLGSGTAGLVAAVRLGMAGQRVLVVEEDRARSSFPGLREPFYLAGMRDGGVVDRCLRELTLPLIDRRRVAPQPVAFQVVGPEVRLDVGEASATADELVAWDLAKPDDARALVRGLVAAADAERQVILDAPIARAGRRMGLRRGSRTAPLTHARGLPEAAATGSGLLSEVLQAQVRALSNVADATPSPEARARLLGAPLAGGAGFEDGPPWLHGLLRRRVESVYGEFRALTGSFELVAVAGQPGVAPVGSSELWLGRVLVVAAASSALRQVVPEERRPDFLDEVRVHRRRAAIHLRAHRSILPEGMDHRVILLNEPHAPASNPITLSRHVRPDHADTVDLVARSLVGPEQALSQREAEIEAGVRAFLPFAGKLMVRRESKAPRWDDDGWLEDSAAGSGWPGETEIRVSTRPPVYRLDRAGVAGLGLEGDLLLGWRSGDRVAAELG